MQCAANALPKLFNIDKRQKPMLVDVLQTLLVSDSSTMVLGSAISAFCEICPNEFDLLHSSLRKVSSIS